MPLTAPVIDDRDFDRIVADAKTLIPRYAPEWTDHNDSDPGITLIKLFAWMTDMLIYRLNQVPELNYVKFLELLGIELNAARPAQVELTFSVAAEAPDPIVIVPLGSQVAVAGAPGEPLVFETDRALSALRAPLRAVRTFDGFSYARVEPQNDDPGQSFHPFGRHARDGSALLLGFDAAGELPGGPIDLACFVAESGEAGGPARACELDLAAIPPPADVMWEFWHERQEWRSLNVVRDETRAFTRSGHVEVDGPGRDAGRSDLGIADEELYWLRARLVRSEYELSPRLDLVVTNTVPATQAQTARDEVVGGSDGSVGQEFLLANVPVVEGSVRLEVDEGLGFRVWQQVDDFLASGPQDEHYVLNRTTGVIRFGDGERGRIPVANPELPSSNVVARHYRYGGGARGNVPAGTVTELQSAIPFVESATNRRGAALGSDEETLEEAKLRAPQELKSKGRAVTAEDFERIAKETPGARVKRAKALPLVHPKFPDARVPGVVTVVVVPESEARNPLPNEATLRAVCAYLNRHRLLTSEVHVSPPRYRKVMIEADVVVEAAFDLAQVKRDVEQALAEYLHPLSGGEDGEGWEFGGNVYFSDISQRVLATPGVDRIAGNNLFIWLGPDRFGPCEDVEIRDFDLVYSEEHEIRVAYRERE